MVLNEFGKEGVDLAKSVQENFSLKEQTYKQIQLYSRKISEDVDTKIHLLVAQNQDNSRISFKFESNPF